MISRNRVVAASAAGVAVLGVAGCGSTLQNAGSVQGGTSALGGTPGASGTSSGGSLSAPTVPGAAAVTGAAPAAAGAGSTAGGSGAPATTGPGGVGAVSQGVGVTAKSVSVGIDYITNGDAANAALGAGGITTGDERADAQAVVDDVNAHGGVAGRKLVPVWHATNAQSTQTRATQDQEECTDLTQDHHVLAVLGNGYTDNFSACVQKAGAIQVDDGEIIYPDDGYFRQFPYYFNLGTLSQDRMMTDQVRTLVRMHYFTGWNTTLGRPGSAPVKIGILGVDVPEWNRPLDRVLLPALRSAGHPVNPTDIYRISNPGSTAEDGQTLTEIQNAELKFHQDGVTHVILLDTGGNFLLLFGRDAKNQHYYPRYGLDSASGMQALYDAGVVQSDQLNGALGLGWNPALDLSAAAGDRYGTASTRHCLAIMKQRTGQTYSSTNAASIALDFCDQLYLLADAINAAGPVITRDTVRAAIERMRSRYVPAALPAAFFSPSRHDAAETGYDMAWDNTCTCVKYVGGPHPIP